MLITLVTPLLPTHVYVDWFSLVAFVNVSTDNRVFCADVVMIVIPALSVTSDPVDSSIQLMDGMGIPKA